MDNQNLAPMNRLIFQLFVCLLTSVSCAQNSGEIESKKEYEITADSVWIETANGKIFGMCYSPIGLNEKLPAVLCLQGGGDVGLSNYLYEAKFFAKQGMVTLVCDKSGAGLSKTNKAWSGQTFTEKIKEYSELLTWLKNHPKSNEELVGVHGMSEGGRLALNLAVDYPEDVAFVNSVSGPLASFKDNQLYAIYNLLHSQNFKFPVIVEALSIWNDYFDEIGRRSISKETVERANQLRLKVPGLRYLPANTIELPNRPLPEDIHFNLVNTVNQIQCPVLFQLGENDARVDPVMTIFLLEEKSNFMVKKYKNTDHNMNFENGNMNPAFLDDKLLWLINDVLDR